MDHSFIQQNFISMCYAGHYAPNRVDRVNETDYGSCTIEGYHVVGETDINTTMMQIRAGL